MVWTPLQQDRLAIEKQTLEKYFRLGITWIDPHNETKVEAVLKSNSDYVYVLRIYIPADFPNSCPVLVVVQPKTLLLRNGTRLPEASYTFHTLPDNDGFGGGGGGVVYSYIHVLPDEFLFKSNSNSSI